MGRHESSSTTPDLIRIVDLAVYTYIGVPEEERRIPQKLLITLEFSGDQFSHAASTDNVSWTIDYAAVAEQIRNISGRRARKLLETLAEEIAFELMKLFPIRRMSLEIKKSVLPDAQFVSVKIERCRQGS